MKGDERRRLPRRHLMFHLRVFDTVTGRYLGNLFDVSHDGLMIIGEEPLPVGHRCSLEMRLPIEIHGRGRVSFAATPAWTSDNIQPGVYETGLGNLEMEDSDRAALERLIAQYGSTD